MEKQRNVGGVDKWTTHHCGFDKSATCFVCCDSKFTVITVKVLMWGSGNVGVGMQNQQLILWFGHRQ